MMALPRCGVIFFAGGLLLLSLCSPALSEDTIKVASIYALSGVAAIGNAESMRGVRAGIEEVNRRGGVLGKRLELLELDNQSTPIGSKVAADQAARAGVIAI
jgi:branched-chain amino acid transport system substrate-binding protein